MSKLTENARKELSEIALVLQAENEMRPNTITALVSAVKTINAAIEELEVRFEGLETRFGLLGEGQPRVPSHG